MRGHWQFRIKCMKCSLHFVVCSWDENWDTKHEPIHCPECGNRAAARLPYFLVFPVAIDQFIFQAVPGALYRKEVPPQE